MAAGNQDEKGICALFVIAAIIMEMARKVEKGECQNKIIFQWVAFRARAIEIKIRTSPTRFISAVIIPAAKDLGF